MSKIFILALALLAFLTPAFAQKRKPVKTKPATPKIYCDGDKIPDGFVIVANDPNGQCRTGGTLTIAKVTANAIICVGSPVPNGYSVQSQTSSYDCKGANANLLANAYRLSGSPVAVQRYKSRRAPAVPVYSSTYGSSSTYVPTHSGSSGYTPTYSSGSVSVRGYYRKNGTYVSSYTRRAPRRRY